MSVFDAYHANPEIIPGILEKSWVKIEEKLELVKPFAKSVHIDLIDGKFADNLTHMDPSNFGKYSKDMLLELHMMVDNPAQYIKPFAAAGFRRFIGHIEHMPDIAEFVAEGQLAGAVALGIDSPTSVEKLKVNLDDLDAVLVMTVKAGYSGQKFMPEMLEKVRMLRERSFELPIEVDGGVNNETIIQAHEAGATRFVTTSCLYGASDIAEKYKKLQEMITKNV